MPTGHLIVQTRTARGAQPVAGASVTVFQLDENNKLRTLTTERTNMSGSTPPITLDAPSLENVSPEAVPPFASYGVNIDHPDFRPVTVSDISIYSGVTTAVPVDMVPPRSLAELNDRIFIQSPETGPSGSGSES
ncbi:MAG: hypothetical protein Q4P20_02650 [Eubacteriales bacterium]|nr:hypothetical protein [Eubacteriales bacterium]